MIPMAVKSVRRILKIYRLSTKSKPKCTVWTASSGGTDRIKHLHTGIVVEQSEQKAESIVLSGVP
jgi:hypothetical protein